MDRIERLRQLFAKGAPLATAVGSNVTGALVALGVGGAEGTVLGAAVRPLLAETLGVVADMVDRRLSEREKQRLGAAVGHIAAGYAEHLQSGDELREDDFVRKDASGRSAADEIMEGVLLRCQREHQERKLPYLCNIVANAPFSSFTSDSLNRIIDIGAAMTYRQMALMAYAGGFEFRDRHIRLQCAELADGVEFKYGAGRLKSPEAAALVRDIRALSERGLLADDGRVSPFGKACARAMSLDHFPNAELLELEKTIQRFRSTEH